MITPEQDHAIQKEIGKRMESSSTRPVATTSRPFGAFFHREEATAYLMVLPIVILVLGLMAYPFVLAVSWSFTDKVIGQVGKFTGFQNFIELAQSSIFRQMLHNAAIYCLASVVLKITLGTVMALALHQVGWFRSFLRGILLLPWVIPTALSCLVWLWMYNDMFGVINYLLRVAGISEEGFLWLASPNLALTAVIIVNVWRGTPFFGIALLGGLQTIPEELYEAAEIDGAGAWRRFVHVTLPHLQSVLAVVTLFSTIWTFFDFEIVYIITRGGPMNSTHLFATLAYQTGLVAGRIGEAVAISLYLFPVLVVMIYLQLLYLRKAEV
jgi:multiple sugar transport system permease protein